MNKERIIGILNEAMHDGCDKWCYDSEHDIYHTSTEHYNQWDYHEYSAFVAEAIAEKYYYEREDSLYEGTGGQR